jgi:hypothetical protein
MSQERRGCLPSVLDPLLTLLFGEKKPQGLPYRLRDDFLSPAEASFYRALKETVGDNVLICPKVSLAELFYITDQRDYRAHFARISQKRVDFVLCDPQSLEPIAAIELDDASHGRRDRRERDAFVQAVFDAAGLPLLHQRAKQGYSRSELAELLVKVYERPDAVEKQPPETIEEPPRETDASAGQPPFCPKCGVPMVLRTARRGSRQGESFYGCPNYPQCREIYRLSDLGMSQPSS